MTEVPTRLRIPADPLSIVVAALADAFDRLGALWTCDDRFDEPRGERSVSTIDPDRPILHGLTVTWSDHSIHGGGAYIGWEVEVHDMQAISL